jgi:hypothetical protein
MTNVCDINFLFKKGQMFLWTLCLLRKRLNEGGKPLDVAMYMTWERCLKSLGNSQIPQNRKYLCPHPASFTSANSSGTLHCLK